MKTIVITGASSGIGKATAEYFAAKGWQVAATMRNPEKASDMVAIDNIKLYELDVTNQASIDAAYNEIIEDFGHVDVLFNNAGFCLFGPLELSSDEQIQRTLDVLVGGVVRMTKKFIPTMREHEGGTIITTSSVGGVLSLPLTPTYHLAKFGVEGFTEGLSYELAPFGIACKVIEPTGVSTDFWNRSLAVAQGVGESPYGEQAQGYLDHMLQPDASRQASPEEIAEVVYTAATDGKMHWRYPAGAGAAAICASRKQMSDDEWQGNIDKSYAAYAKDVQ